MTDIENGNGTKNGAHSSSLKKEKSQDPIGKILLILAIFCIANRSL